MSKRLFRIRRFASAISGSSENGRRGRWAVIALLSLAPDANVKCRRSGVIPEHWPSRRSSDLVACLGGIDMDPLEQVKKQREEYERALDVAESQRAAYHEAVLDLYRSGTPLREIAKELGLSHQRVHQIVSGEPPRRKKLPRAAGGIGAALVLFAATFGALRIAHAPPFVQATPVPTAQETAACLNGHGWTVAQHSRGVVVATKGHYRLFYRPSRRTGPIVHGARALAGLITIIHTVVPGCFQQYAPSIHSFASSSQ